ncbi:MAG: UvrD-helicase domain-containing protein [Clostridia bacterium]|nr:UvrD-helicase domain-containing protein [Clostridia bacterium]
MDNNKLTANRFISAKKALFDKLYDNLNKCQREAVFTANGPLLVLAGAGTGKTTVLVNRIAYIIKYGNLYYSEEIPSEISEDDVEKLNKALSASKEEISEILGKYVTDACPPWTILSITFTNKAANEMKTRLAATLGEESASEIWAGTFHSVCVKLLRRFGEKVGYPKSFTIYDTDDSKKLVASCMRDLQIDDKKLPPKSILSQISSLKNNLKTPQIFSAEIGSDFRLSQLASIYTLYQKKLSDANALDFDDIIMQTVKLLSEDEEARNYCQRRFKYVSVDEFQDTNYAQLKLVELLSGLHRNLMVVGDDDQSIYKFRGATIENILNFDREYKDAKVIRLEQNYRSTSYILDAANGVIKNNQSRHAKELFSDRGKGEKIVVKKCDNQNEEAKYIINKIMDMVIREKRKYSDFAVLYRMNAQSNNLEQIFARSGIPYRVIGGQRFYDRKEIRDVMAYLAVINNPNDDLRLKRIINEPKRKIGEKTLSDIEYLASINGESCFEVMKSASKYPQICKNSTKLKEFVSIIEKLREISRTAPISELFEKTIEISGYRDMLIAGGQDEAERLDNVKELISNAIEFEKNHTAEEANLETFLEEVALISDIDNYDDDNNAVVLMTIHSAKGLEFPIVFLPGVEEGIFPSVQTTAFPEELEEERRLAYVAITRAKDELFCIHVRERLMFGRTQYNQLSRFISEIPEECIEIKLPRGAEFGSREQVKQKKNVISREFFIQPAVKATVGNKTFERFKVGDRVSHMTFGEGVIMSAREMGTDVLYEIAFDNYGTKKLMATYAKLKRSDE